jgi:hypothetical protein
LGPLPGFVPVFCANLLAGGAITSAGDCAINAARDVPPASSIAASMIARMAKDLRICGPTARNRAQASDARSTLRIQAR